LKVTHVMVELEKMLSDGNYGRERAVVQFAADLDEGDDAQQVTTLLLSQARHRFEHELGRSESVTVRRAIHPKPRLCEECKKPLTDEEDYEHAACTEVRRERARQDDEARRLRYAEERQQRQAEYELVTAGHVDGDTDEDADDDREDEPL
jgi:hypothetical protein